MSPDARFSRALVSNVAKSLKGPRTGANSQPLFFADSCGFSWPLFLLGELLSDQGSPILPERTIVSAQRRNVTSETGS